MNLQADSDIVKITFFLNPHLEIGTFRSKKWTIEWIKSSLFHIHDFAAVLNGSGDHAVLCDVRGNLAFGVGNDTADG